MTRPRPRRRMTWRARVAAVLARPIDRVVAGIVADDPNPQYSTLDRMDGLR